MEITRMVLGINCINTVLYRMSKKLTGFLFLFVILIGSIFLIQHFHEGFEVTQPIAIMTPPHTPTPTSETTTTPTSTTTTTSPVASLQVTSNDLDVIQKFLLARGDFTNSVNDLIVFLSKKGNYTDLITKLDDIKQQVSNI